jgi:hypothetical protein
MLTYAETDKLRELEQRLQMAEEEVEGARAAARVADAGAQFTCFAGTQFTDAGTQFTAGAAARMADARAQFTCFTGTQFTDAGTQFTAGAAARVADAGDEP